MVDMGDGEGRGHGLEQKAGTESPGPALRGYFGVRVNSRPAMTRVKQARSRAMRMSLDGVKGVRV